MRRARWSVVGSVLCLGFALPLAACGGKVDFISGSGSGATSGTVGQGGGGAGGAPPTCNPAQHTIDVADYDTSCVDTSDCAPVFAGDLCGVCDCPTAAINSSELAKYQAEVAVKDVGTPPNECLCPAIPKGCVAGQCVLGVF